MARQPLKLLSKLRRYSGQDVGEYLKTEFRQNLKAIEDAFNNITSDAPAVVETGIPYSMYIKKSTIIAITSGVEVAISGYDVTTLREFGPANWTFDATTGIGTCNVTGTYLFFARFAIAANSGAELYVRIYLDGVVWASAYGQSTAVRGNIASFGTRVTAGSTVQMKIETLGTQNSERVDVAPVFFNIVQSGTT